MSRAAFDDDELIGIIDGINSIDELSSSQRQQIRFDCLYLRKAYEVAVQNMNQITWKDCIIIAIDEMKDGGFNHIKKEKDIRRINQQFRRANLFSAPFVHNKRDPMLFSVFPSA